MGILAKMFQQIVGKMEQTNKQKQNAFIFHHHLLNWEEKKILKHQIQWK